VRACFLIPDPSVAPDRWTERSLELRNEATITGRCPVCRAVARYMGVDFREVAHSQVRHAADCRCSDERIRKHLKHRGLEMEEERYLVAVVDYPEAAAS
jgi:hypothetical protein